MKKVNLKKAIGSDEITKIMGKRTRFNTWYLPNIGIQTENLISYLKPPSYGVKSKQYSDLMIVRIGNVFPFYPFFLIKDTKLTRLSLIIKC